MRVILVEDNALLREGLVAVMRDQGIDVLHALPDADALPALVRAAPGDAGVDVVVLDVRLPPTFTDEGVRAAVQLRTDHPGVGVVILSQYVELAYTADLLAGGSGGVGYLLKERVGNVAEFLDSLRRVAAGGTALDREVVVELLAGRSGPSSGGAELASLSPREREVLALMAEGRSNAAIAAALVVGPGAVEKHVANIFAKLGLPPALTDHRRVLAVLTHLRATAGG